MSTQIVTEEMMVPSEPGIDIFVRNKRPADLKRHARHSGPRAQDHVPGVRQADPPWATLRLYRFQPISLRRRRL